MDLNKADPDTQTEVDTVVLDYLLCTAIETTISNRVAERQGQQTQWDVGWHINSINSTPNPPSASRVHIWYSHSPSS